MGTKPDTSASLEQYTVAAEQASGAVIETYSTSFGLATKLLNERIRTDIRNVYALVRVADEIVDGAAAGNGATKVQIRRQLDDLEAEVYAAMKLGFSTNLVVHAFAQTATRTGITRPIIEPFFHSMRMDITQAKHTPKTFKEYVYGSAEVVGLMCLRAFISGRESQYSVAEHQTLEKGALALGSAFQKINFLRDLAADFKSLGRSYFPNVSVSTFNEEQKALLVADIYADLIVAARSLPLLPKDVRPAVAAAQFLFQDLTAKVAATPASVLINTRISVSNPRKLWLVSKSMLGVLPR